MMERVRVDAGVSRGMRVLDLGCGHGNLSQMIALGAPSHDPCGPPVVGSPPPEDLDGRRSCRADQRRDRARSAATP
jgi:hypothetical protein